MKSLLNSRRVVVTGLGLVTPLGIGVANNWANLKLGNDKSGFVCLLTDGNTFNISFLEKILINEFIL